MPRSKSIKFAIAIIALVGAGPLSARAQAPGDARQQIEKANAQFMAAVARGDAKAVAAMYTKGAQVFPPNQPLVQGHANIETFWRATLDSGIKAIDLKTREVEACGDTIIETGAATVFGEGESVIDEGKYVVIWKREGGHWRLHRDCWNSSRPVPTK
jgi:uncharacterized protein (TIGR02246 family)